MAKGKRHSPLMGKAGGLQATRLRRLPVAANDNKRPIGPLLIPNLILAGLVIVAGGLSAFAIFIL